MELSDYIRIIRRRGWLIILLSVLTALAAYGFSRMQTPVYEASVRLLITSRPDFGQTQAVKEELRDYAEWLRSRRRTQAVIDTLQLDMTPEQVLSDGEVAASTSEDIIRIHVENTNPALASDIARTWATELIHWRQEQNAGLRKEDRIEAELIDDPVVGLASPQTKINTAAGAVFGALLGLIIVFLLEWIESGVVRRPDDIERYLEIPVIGSIPGQ